MRFIWKLNEFAVDHPRLVMFGLLGFVWVCAFTLTLLLTRV